MKRSIVLSTEAGTYGISGVNARGYVIDTPGDNPTSESRLSSLEKNIRLIHERISETERQFDTQLKKMDEAIKREEALRASEDAATRQKLEATGTGGVHISAIGATWIFFG